MNLHVPNPASLPTGLAVDAFLAWSERQPQAKYELFDGRVIMQQSERWAQPAIKTIPLLAVAVPTTVSSGSMRLAPPGIEIAHAAVFPKS